MATNPKQMYSSEEVRIMLLEQRSDDFHQTLLRLETKIDALDARIDSNFKWTLGLIFGLYATNIATLIAMLGKAYNWF